jgi:hypothetical protein
VEQPARKTTESDQSSAALAELRDRDEARIVRFKRG